MGKSRKPIFKLKAKARDKNDDTQYTVGTVWPGAFPGAASLSLVTEPNEKYGEAVLSGLDLSQFWLNLVPVAEEPFYDWASDCLKVKPFKKKNEATDAVFDAEDDAPF